jgi:GT2 family glycosyltransferase
VGVLASSPAASLSSLGGAGILNGVSRRRIPDAILDAAHARAAARAERRWDEADRLREEIEAAGWKIVDRGTDFALTPAAAPTVEAAGVVRYGSSMDVPSRLGEPPTDEATVILVATDWPEDLGRALAALRRHGPDGTALVVVADAPGEEQEDALEELASPSVEIVRTSARLGRAAALNAGIRRAIGRVVIVLDTSVEPTGDVVTPLVRALDDPSVAVAGGWGIVSDDLRRFRDAPPGDVDAIEGYAIAFRRDDAASRGPLDERFRFYRNLDIWWSLVLRDEGVDRQARRAVAVGIPAIRHEHRDWSSLPEPERDRLSKRNFYRIIDRFGSRRDLAGGDRG